MSRIQVSHRAGLELHAGMVDFFVCSFCMRVQAIGVLVTGASRVACVFKWNVSIVRGASLPNRGARELDQDFQVRCVVNEGRQGSVLIGLISG